MEQKTRTGRNGKTERKDARHGDGAWKQKSKTVSKPGAAARNASTEDNDGRWAGGAAETAAKAPACPMASKWPESASRPLFCIGKFRRAGFYDYRPCAL